jgi:cytochrome c-type biogenesis protein CcmH/NrfG
LAAFGCKISVPGTKHRSYRTGLPTVPRRGFDRNNFVVDQGLIILYETAGATGTLISATSFAASAKAKAAFKRGRKLLTLDPPNAVAAQAEMREAVRLYPRFAAAWSGLGHALAGAGDIVGAREAFDRAIEADPSFIEPYPALLAVMTEQQEWPAVAEAAANWSALDPENIEAVYFLALGLFGERNINGAEIAATKVAASKEARRFPQARHLLGAIYTMRGEYEAAAREFRALAELEPEGSLASAARALLDEWVREGKISSGGAVPRPSPPGEAHAG